MSFDEFIEEIERLCSESAGRSLRVPKAKLSVYREPYDLGLNPVDALEYIYRRSLD